MDEFLVDAFFSMIFTFVPLMVLMLLPYAGISLARFSIPSLFVIFYLAVAYAGILPLYFGWIPYPVTLGVTNKAIILDMFFCSATALLLTVCGFIFAHRGMGLHVDALTNRTLESANAAQRILIFSLSLLCGAVFFAYIRQIETIALFKALEGEILEAAVARSNMGTAFEGKYWRYEIFFRLLIDYCVVFFFAEYLIKQRKVSLLIFLGCFLFASFSALMAVEKGPFIKLLMALYLVFVVYKGGNYWQREFKYFLMLSVSAVVVFYTLFMGGSDILSILVNIGGRIFTGQLTPAYFYLVLFPHQIDYLWGASFPNPAGMFSFEHFHLTKVVADYMSPESLNLGIIGSAPTVFWAEMYANFGFAGITLPSFLVGIWLFAVSHVFSKFRPAPPLIAATVMLAMHYRDLVGTSLTNYLIDLDFVIILLVTFVAKYLDRR